MTLQALPNELLLRIASFLGPDELLSLGATSREMQSAFRSDAVWMPVVRAICELAPPPVNRSRAHEVQSFSSGHKERLNMTWFDKARFLCPRVHRLGFFASSSAYVSRIVYLYVELLPGACIIRAEQLIPRNRYKDDSVDPPAIPTGARLDLDRTSYDLPAAAPCPDAGLSFDLLHYDSMFLPLFRIDPFNGARFAGPSSNELRLRLRASETTVTLSPDITQADDEQNGQSNRDLRNLWSLFTGRGPARKWPTSALAGGRGAAALRRPYGSTAQPERADVTPAEFKTEGFHLQVLQKVKGAQTPKMQSTMSHAEAERMLDSVERPRGSPDILFDGQREDPADRDRVTIIQAGGGHALGMGGMTFRLPHAPLRQDDEEQPDETEEVLRTEREDFFPIKQSTSLAELDDSHLMDESGELRAESFEGVWVGTYGPHGLELGYVSVCWADSRQHRILQFVKITGDQNVPSGELSWEATLPPDETALSSSDELGTIHSVHADQLLQWSSLLPSTNLALPADSLSAALRERESSKWSKGRYDGRRRVAMTGFVQPGWMSAYVTLVRNTVDLNAAAAAGPSSTSDIDSTMDSGTNGNRTREVVNEIRVSWPDMGKVSVFKRVEIPFEPVSSSAFATSPRDD